MDFKTPSIICRYLFCVSLIITYVLAQPPPPPEVPTDQDQIRLNSTIPDQTNTAANVLPECTDLICTMEYIPEECRETPVLTRNGVNCTGCSQWKAICKKGQIVNKTQEVMPPDVACPIASCPNIKVPPECLVRETYLYLGKTCDKCPTVKANCPANNIANNEASCPVQACTLQLIPAECREVPTFQHNGLICNGCPQWRSGCQTMRQGNRFPRIACPLIRCDMYIPDECRIDQEYEYGGQMCKKCPSWRQGCRVAERSVFMTGSVWGGAVDHLGNEVRQTLCPRFPCRELNVPSNCIQEQPFEYRGNPCFKCPTVRPECLPARSMELATAAPQVPCPLLKCERRFGVPADCYQPEQYIHRGKVCQGCPSIKPECRMVESPRPIIAVDPMDTGRPDTSEVPCPRIGCPLIYIPPECREDTSYEVNGRTCSGCPVYREGCMPILASPVPTPSSVFPEIPARITEVRCPARACPTNDIPAECRIESPYQYQGRTCYDCPTWRESCRPNNRGVQNTACPMFGCPRIYIPSECREEQTFQRRGVTCKMCPTWREGCMPSGERPIIDPTPLRSTTRSPPVEITAAPENACPMLGCPYILIPPECVEEVTFQRGGVTCKLCPKWREGCIPSGDRLIIDPASSRSTTRAPPVEITVAHENACPMLGCPYIYIPPECVEDVTFQRGGVICKLCPKWREGCIPSGERLIIDPAQPRSTTRAPPVEITVAPEKACPMVPCPRIYIPEQCRLEQPYDFQGKTCYKCPTWRESCRKSNNGQFVSSTIAPAPALPDTGIKIPSNSPSLTDFKGLLPVNRIIDTVNAATCPPLRCPDMFIPFMCREETTYVYQRRTCRGCPRWRLGCNAQNNVPLNTNPNGILSFSLFNELFAT